MANADLYTPALLEHGSDPDNRYEMPCPTCSRAGLNPSCGDDIVLSLRVEDGRIAEAAFTGSGCAVSQASTDMMADAVAGLPLAEARALCGLFERMVRGEEADPAALAPLGEAACLRSVARMPARVKCAELGWRTLAELIDGLEEGKGVPSVGADKPLVGTDDSVSVP